MIKKSLLILLLQSLIFTLSVQTWAACNIKNSNNKALGSANSFVTDAIYALHRQFTNEQFNTKEAAKSRALLFDTVFDAPFWVSKIGSRQTTHLLWNWVRTQYWGAINQQALLKEEQGFKARINRGLHIDLNKIYKFPIFPAIAGSEEYTCKSKDKSFYPCSQRIYSFDVILSPALACSRADLQENLTFQYLVTKTAHGWVLLDVHLKGIQLIRDTYRGYEDLSNKYGQSKALAHTQRLSSMPYTFPANDQPPHSGDIAFNRKYKIKLPKYPLSY